MPIEDLYERLVAFAIQRVRAGELTERGLARMCGISQPHMHNVLKHIRALSPGSASRLMNALGVTVTELMWNAADGGGSSITIVPVMRSRIGPGIESMLSSCGGSMPFSRRTVEHLVDPIVAQVGPDLVLPSMVATDDFILLDQNPELRSRPRGDGCWVVAESTGLRIRYVITSNTKVYIANQATIKNQGDWNLVSPHNRSITDIVRARIAGIVREIRLN